jgi:hypothetical protein
MKNLKTFDQHINESVTQDVIYMSPSDKPQLKQYNEKLATVISDDGDTLTIKFEDGKTLTVVPKKQVRYVSDTNEGAETLLPDVSDERIVDAWASAIGGNQPAMDKMRKDLLDLMKRDKISFIEIEGALADVNEHHGDEWPNAMLSMPLSSFLDSVKTMDVTAYNEIEQVIGRLVNNGFMNSIEEDGLWANIHAKRKRGEKPSKPGDKDYPNKKAWKHAEED